MLGVTTTGCTVFKGHSFRKGENHFSKMSRFKIPVQHLQAAIIWSNITVLCLSFTFYKMRIIALTDHKVNAGLPGVENNSGEGNSILF